MFALTAQTLSRKHPNYQLIQAESHLSLFFLRKSHTFIHDMAYKKEQRSISKTDLFNHSQVFSNNWNNTRFQLVARDQKLGLSRDGQINGTELSDLPENWDKLMSYIVNVFVCVARFWKKNSKRFIFHLILNKKLLTILVGCKVDISYTYWLWRHGRLFVSVSRFQPNSWCFTLGYCYTLVSTYT